MIRISVSDNLLVFIMLVTIEEAASVLNLGGVLAYPTETFWGLAVVPTSTTAVDRLVLLKQRVEAKGISLIVANCGVAEELMLLDKGYVRDCYKSLSECFWPGPLTIVANPSPVACKLFHRRVFATDGSLALRVPSLAYARELADRVGGVITATSANPADCRPAATVAEVEKYYSDLPVCRLDIGCAEYPLSSDDSPFVYSLASTIVDIRSNPPKVLRLGAVPVEKLSQEGILV